MIIHLDDYTSGNILSNDMLINLVCSIGESELKVHALMGASTPDALLRMSARIDIDISLHGWDHFSEPGFGYWKALHLFQTAKSWDCFDANFKMPWDKMPRPGFLRALRESDFTFVTPYRWKAKIARWFGCKVNLVNPDFLLHPVDLWLGSPQLRRLKAALEKRDV